jgi:hypothetical protein
MLVVPIEAGRGNIAADNRQPGDNMQMHDERSALTEAAPFARPGLHFRSRVIVPIILGLWLVSLGPSTSHAQQEHIHGAPEATPPPRVPATVDGLRALRTTHGLRTATAVRLEGDTMMQLDHRLDESVWQRVQLNGGFLQRDPREGEPSTEDTEFRVLYDRDKLYIGVLCYDSEPDKILATERRHDARMQSDDTVAILLDTFHDHRNFFLFQTNPLGTRHAVLITDEGRDQNAGWDPEWEVAAHIIPGVGWSALFAIPFKSLRVPGTEAQVWGLDVERVIRRKNEFTYWTNFKRDFKRENISQVGHLRGIEGFDPGFRLRVKPFMVGGFTHSANHDTSATKHANDAGIEILKFRVTPGLMVDFIANSNFVDTEIDPQRVNLDRWGLFYEERREFFQEAGIFKFGVATGEMPAPDVALFHTRQIGYHSRRVGSSYQQVPVPIRGGARLTGDVGGFSVGLLNVQTDRLLSENIPASNYGVVRVKRDILARSAIGGFFLNREVGGQADYNRVYGFDANFILKDHLFTNLLYAHALQPGVEQDSWTLSGSTKWDSDRMYAGLEYLVVEPNFRDDLGFVPRPDQRRVSPIFDLKPRVERLSEWIRRFQVGVRLDYITDQQSTLLTRYEHYNFQILFQSGDRLLVAPHRRFERVTEEFPLRTSVQIPAGDYQMTNFRIAYTASPARRIAGTYVFQPQWGYFGGKLYQLQLRPRITASRSLTLVPGYSLNMATTSQGDFTDHIVNAGIDQAFNNQWLISSSIQYNNADAIAAMQFQLNYLFRPGDRFSLVYRLDRATAGSRFGRTDHTLAAKMTYFLDF